MPGPAPATTDRARRGPAPSGAHRRRRPADDAFGRWRLVRHLARRPALRTGVRQAGAGDAEGRGDLARAGRAHGLRGGLDGGGLVRVARPVPRAARLRRRRRLAGDDLPRCPASTVSGRPSCATAGPTAPWRPSSAGGSARCTPPPPTGARWRPGSTTWSCSRPCGWSPTWTRRRVPTPTSRRRSRRCGPPTWPTGGCSSTATSARRTCSWGPRGRCSSTRSAPPGAIPRSTSPSARRTCC